MLEGFLCLPLHFEHEKIPFPSINRPSINEPFINQQHPVITLRACRLTSHANLGAMISVTVLSLLIATLLFQPCYSSNIPVQVDLVFPRNNTVYKPDWPFPVVFAIHNFSTAWKFKPRVSWRVVQHNYTTREEYKGGEGVIGWNDHAQSDWAPPPQSFLAVNATNGPTFTNESNWRLKWYFYMDTKECVSSITTLIGKVFFNTSRTAGIAADFTTLSSCAPSIGAIGLDGFSLTNDLCAIMSSPQPDPRPCAVSVDRPTANRIVDVLNQFGDVMGCACKPMTFPSIQILGKGNGCEPCPSEGNLLQKSSLVMVLSVIASVFVWLKI